MNLYSNIFQAIMRHVPNVNITPIENRKTHFLAPQPLQVALEKESRNRACKQSSSRTTIKIRLQKRVRGECIARRKAPANLAVNYTNEPQRGARHRDRTMVYKAVVHRERTRKELA